MHTTVAYLEFDPERNQMQKKKELRHGLSVAIQIGKTLWVANDETVSLERLTLNEKDSQGNYHFGAHKQYLLKDFLKLPVTPADAEDGLFEEADIEGLDYKDGYLWLVGSHSLKRSKVHQKDPADEQLSKLSNVGVDGNRYLLARIPAVKEGDLYTLKERVVEKGTERLAAQLKGHDKGNQLTKKLKKDEHLQGFFNIPGKENGFDIEGIAVADNRIFLGMRGPVLRGWAVVLELTLKKPSGKNPSELKIKTIRKHFLQLGGLGIRDLYAHGADLFILAGPTMDLDGPVTIFRWKNAFERKENNFVFKENLDVVMEVPYGKGSDHAEGISLFSATPGEPPFMLVVYDAAAENRFVGESSVTADLFPLA